MIQPVVFPFTSLDENVAGRILSCFNNIRIYVPTASATGDSPLEMVKNGLIEARLPLADKGADADRIFSDYRRWREANRGTDLSFLKSLGDSVPFFNESTISFLKQDILRAVPEASGTAADLLPSARVFLRMTGDYDRVQAEIAEELLSQDVKEISMLAALQGEDADEEEERPGALAGEILFSDAGELMAAERLNAWSILAVEDDQLPALFVTPSRAVLAAVRERLEDTGTVWQDIPVPDDYRHRGQAAYQQWRHDLEGFLDGLLRGGTGGRGQVPPPDSPAGQGRAFLTIIHLTNVSPRCFLEKLRYDSPENRPCPENDRTASTIVAAILPS